MESQPISGNNDSALPGIQSATKLSPLDLNGIKLDVRHTLLTPDYLENLPKENS